jgi:hyperosmotically inducible periplasmic protein
MCKRIRSLLLPACCAVLTMALATGTGLSQSGKQGKPGLETPNDRSANRVQNIVKEVRHELIMIPDYDVFDWLEGEVKPDGTVTLRGETIRPTLKSEAEKRVKEIESVSKVVNEIRVLPLSTMDDEIRIATYRALFNGNSPLMRYGLRSVPPIHIIVDHGHVTLKGVVANQMDKQLAETAARGISGTFDVKNELQVESKPTN